MNKTGALCPQCGGDLVERKTKQTVDAPVADAAKSVAGKIAAQAQAA